MLKRALKGDLGPAQPLVAGPRQLKAFFKGVASERCENWSVGEVVGVRAM
jgi:hypothetical protein